MDTQLITVTSKGQVAIPVNIRKQLNINEGTKLVLCVVGNTIMLKVLKIPTAEEFAEQLEKSQEWAKSVNLTEEEVNEIIKSVRKKK